MLNLVVFFLLLILFCLVSVLAIRQYAAPKSSRKKINKHRNRKAIDKNYVNEEAKRAIVGIVLILGFIVNISNNGIDEFRTLPTYQRTDNSLVPVLHDYGPSSDGKTTITVTNSVPRPLVFAIKHKKQNQDFELASCQSCKLYANSSEIPKNVCELGNDNTIDVPPGENQVYWYYKNTTKINPINATWKISPGHQYSTCIIMDLSEGRANWDSK